MKGVSAVALCVNRTTWLLAVTVTVSGAWGCNRNNHGDPGEGARATGPSIIDIALNDGPGSTAEPLRRPAVEFDHGLHTEELAAQGCEACHPKKTSDTSPAAAQPLELTIRRSFGNLDRDGLMDAYHELCMGCHQQRADQGQSTGALACGECHEERGKAVSQRQAMAFDYALHYRHSQAEEDECGHCHHTERDGASGKLVHESGKEESCRGCHGTTEQEGRSTLRSAVHQDCVNCHIERHAKEAPAGPVECTGCHEASAQAAIKPPDNWDTLWQAPNVKQPKTVWIGAADAKSGLVPFDHAAHEPRTSSCSSCHHQRLQKCDRCHTLTGSDKGKGVTLEDAYHRATASFSCVGCHEQQTQQKSCAGCHETMARPPGEAACARCHSGPSAALGMPDTPPELDEVVLTPLPEVGDGFPETVVIDGLQAEYGPVTFPHRKIVAALDGTVRDSVLAKRFHGSTAALCAGCHHESPLGTRPPPCRSCHSNTAHPTTDMPALKGAYHRQCMGCHQQMAIEPVGCTEGCHEKAAKESGR